MAGAHGVHSGVFGSCAKVPGLHALQVAAPVPFTPVSKPEGQLQGQEPHSMLLCELVPSVAA